MDRFVLLDGHTMMADSASDGFFHAPDKNQYANEAGFRPTMMLMTKGLALRPDLQACKTRRLLENQT
ncbi:hypothetical protein H072_10333 [Dactylellina haptotyla CBS 200.50]|uniref:Uncharacterized protein n=1 Tax=Dactylellina haptotyla (strain CBS 200.50) TaxID=1284197 RepID=S8BAR7_DACHA|nr:hypothetical protein H072_10333 [Dactylellina haptotyla CBS 200.50]